MAEIFRKTQMAGGGNLSAGNSGSGNTTATAPRQSGNVITNFPSGIDFSSGTGGSYEGGLVRESGVSPLTTAYPWGYQGPSDCGGCSSTNGLHMCDLLRESIGYYIISEHLVGTNSLQYRVGLLTRVEANCFVLYQEENRTNLICDYYSLKFFRRWPKGQKPQVLDYQALEYQK